MIIRDLFILVITSLFAVAAIAQSSKSSITGNTKPVKAEIRKVDSGF